MSEMIQNDTITPNNITAWFSYETTGEGLKTFAGYLFYPITGPAGWLYRNSPPICGNTCEGVKTATSEFFKDPATNQTSFMAAGANTWKLASSYVQNGTVIHSVGSTVLSSLAIVVPPTAAAIAADLAIKILQGKAEEKHAALKAISITAVAGGTILIGSSSTEGQLFNLSIALTSALAVSMYRAANAKPTVFKIEDIRKFHKECVPSKEQTDENPSLEEDSTEEVENGVGVENQKETVKESKDEAEVNISENEAVVEENENEEVEFVSEDNQTIYSEDSQETASSSK